MDVFNSVVSGNLSINGVNQGNVSGNAAVTVQVTLNSINGNVFNFGTRMTQLDIHGLGGNPNVWVRIDPNTPSNGQTTETVLGGGLFQISSFFDVFTDLSLDGGVTWSPSPTNASRVTLVESTPEPVSVLFAGLGLAAIGVRRALKR
jgi:hypothetical protein